MNILILISLLAFGWADTAFALSEPCKDEKSFSLKIKQIVKERNLKKLTDLFLDEGTYIPPADYLKRKKFSDIFSDKWRADLLGSKTITSCEWYKGPNIGDVWFAYDYDTPASGGDGKCCKIWSVQGWIGQDLYGAGRVFGPKGAMPPNVLDVMAVKENKLLWALHSGSYKLGSPDMLQGATSPCRVREARQFEGLRLTIAKDGVTVSRKEQDVKAFAKYFGAAFHLPFNGHCGSIGCSPGISGHSYVYKLSKPVITGECIEDLKYIIVAFNSDQWAYNRVFLSSLSSTDEAHDEIDLDELERNNFQPTKSIRQTSSISWIQTVCEQAANGNPDAVKEAKIRNLTDVDCQQFPVSDKEQMPDDRTSPGSASNTTTTKPAQVYVYADRFFRLKPITKKDERVR